MTVLAVPNLHTNGSMSTITITTTTTTTMTQQQQQIQTRTRSPPQYEKQSQQQQLQQQQKQESQQSLQQQQQQSQPQGPRNSTSNHANSRDNSWKQTSTKTAEPEKSLPIPQARMTVLFCNLPAVRPRKVGTSGGNNKHKDNNNNHSSPACTNTRTCTPDMNSTGNESMRRPLSSSLWSTEVAAPVDEYNGESSSSSHGAAGSSSAVMMTRIREALALPGLTRAAAAATIPPQSPPQHESTPPQLEDPKKSCTKKSLKQQVCSLLLLRTAASQDGSETDLSFSTNGGGGTGSRCRSVSFDLTQNQEYPSPVLYVDECQQYYYTKKELGIISRNMKETVAEYFRRSKRRDLPWDDTAMGEAIRGLEEFLQPQNEFFAYANWKRIKRSHIRLVLTEVQRQQQDQLATKEKKHKKSRKATRIHYDDEAVRVIACRNSFVSQQLAVQRAEADAVEAGYEKVDGVFVLRPLVEV